MLRAGKETDKDRSEEEEGYGCNHKEALQRTELLRLGKGSKSGGELTSEAGPERLVHGIIGTVVLFSEERAVLCMIVGRGPAVVVSGHGGSTSNPCGQRLNLEACD
jgi:hypothetical protein